MIISKAIAPLTDILGEEIVDNTLSSGLKGRFKNQRVLVLIPDHTRSLPLSMLFHKFVSLFTDVKQLDYLVALGTHPPLSEKKLCELVGIDQRKRNNEYRYIGLLNHAWSDPESLKTIGTISREEVKQLAGKFWHPSLGEDVPVRINKAALQYDQIIIIGPTFPHEVAGFSGGAKYFFPGISGPEMINVTHWLGALTGITNTIGIPDTPVRKMIHAAAAKISTPVTLVALVVDGDGLAGIIIGDIVDAWQEATSLSEKRHIYWCSHSFKQILSCPSPRYDELWTAAKAMYKLESVTSKGGEIIVYAPHLEEVSQVHGRYIYEAGYHTLSYFLENWLQYEQIPLGVLAHLTHLRGPGLMENGIEIPDIRVTLASRISKEDCSRLNLGYLDPGYIDPSDFMNREKEGVLYVPNAGEILYRLKTPSSL